MNDYPTTSVAEEPTVLDLIEILDADGNPTGQYRAASAGETAPEETAFIAADDAAREVTVH